jgi:hypothetical protein
MPGLVRKLVIFAAVDGLILQPNGNGHRNGSNTQSPIQIEYSTRKISTLPATPTEQPEKKSVSLEAHGIVGMQLSPWLFRDDTLILTDPFRSRANIRALSTGILTVASYSFLISITQREQVAQILGKPIYAVTNVAVIPLSSQLDASRAIAQARENLSQGEEGPGEKASEDASFSEAETDISEDSSVTCPAEEADQAPGGTDRGKGIAEDVIGNKGRYGRFLASWLSRKRWGPAGPFLPTPTAGGDGDSKRENVTLETTSQPTSGPSVPGVKEEAEATPVVAEVSSEVAAQTAATPGQTIDLMPKLLRYTKLIFASRNFFFAYDYDLTRRFGTQDPRKCHLPLHSTVDPLVWTLALPISTLDFQLSLHSTSGTET